MQIRKLTLPKIVSLIGVVAKENNKVQLHEKPTSVFLINTTSFWMLSNSIATNVAFTSTD